MNYPVLIIEEKDNMLYVFNKRDFTTRTIEGLRKWPYNTGILVDPEGKRYKPNGFKLNGWANPFFGFNILLWTQEFKVTPNLVYVDEITLDELKTIVCNKMDSSKGMSRHLYTSRMSIKDYKKKIMESHSHGEIIQLLR